MALLTTMLYAAAQVDQAIDLEFALARQETDAASIDMGQNVGGGKGADVAALAAAPNR